jgi:general L-amino acid transport system permease protein
MKNADNKSSDTHQTEMAPPKSSVGILGWLKKNLFSNWLDTFLTIIFASILYFVLKGSLQWIFGKAQWEVVSANFRLLTVGQFPLEEIWRIWINLSILTVLLGLSWGVWKGILKHLSIALSVLLFVLSVLPFMVLSTRVWLVVNIALIVGGYFIGNKFPQIKKIILVGWVLLFPITLFLLSGFGILPTVGTNLWGGFLLTILISIVSIVFSFPLGVLLALGRRSKLPVVRWFSIGYIELIRGVPLVTILFMAQFMLPLFLEGVELDKVLRAMIAFTLFNAAYLAENVRGGLQSIPRNQYEAAQALGLNATLMMTFVIMPQALRAVIPALVGQFISIFKDTSLVAIVGLLDLLGIGKFIVANPAFLGKQMEVFLFVALTYWIFSYSMSFVSRRLEGSLGVGK